MRNNRPYNFSKPRNWKPETWQKKQQLARQMRETLEKLFSSNGSIKSTLRGNDANKQ